MNSCRRGELNLKQPDETWKALAEIDKVTPALIEPDRVELTVRQARASVALGNLDQSEDYLKSAGASAKALAPICEADFSFTALYFFTQLLCFRIVAQACNLSLCKTSFFVSEEFLQRFSFTVPVVGVVWLQANGFIGGFQ